MKLRLFAMLLAFSLIAWAQEAPSTPAPNSTPKSEAKSCCHHDHAAAAKDAKGCCHHGSADAKDAAGCCGGKDMAKCEKKDGKSCCDGKEAKACMEACKKTGGCGDGKCCKEGDGKSAMNCCGNHCAGHEHASTAS